MKSPNLIFRRTHLYLGMLMLPWMAMYALSTVVFNHAEAFGVRRAGNAPWTPLWEKDYAIEVPAANTANDALRDTTRRLLADNGLPAGAFGVQRQGQRLTITLPSFRRPTRLTYDIAGKKLRAEQKKNSPLEILMRLHERTGYGQERLLNKVWGLMVDIFCVGTLAWIATGLYLWWKLPGLRASGFAAITAGAATIAILLASL